MKIATFTLFLGSATAFAPAQNGRVESTSMLEKFCIQRIKLSLTTVLALQEQPP